MDAGDSGHDRYRHHAQEIARNLAVPLGPPKIDWYAHGDPPSRGPVLKAPLINGLMEGADQ
jgi:hypothetical protein